MKIKITTSGKPTNENLTQVAEYLVKLAQAK